MNRTLALLLLAISSTSSAVVIRHDVDDAKYQVPASEFPALVDFPGEAHGTLIAPQWVLTAAHVVESQHVAEVTINGKPRKVERVVIHPGYKLMPDTMISEALRTGDSLNAYEFMGSRDDIALVKLAAPVADVTPATLYRGDNEVAKTIEVIGKGATGNGVDGESLHGSHRTILRRAFNEVVDADERWLWYTFDAPPAGLPLEGITGGGDSGSPVILEDKGKKVVVGFGSWSQYAPSTDRPFHAGLYGQIVYNVRVSRYASWIESVMAGKASNADSVGAAGH
jgi:hypothetical protein